MLRQGSLQVSFEELTVPAVAILEGHIHSVPVFRFNHVKEYRRIRDERCPRKWSTRRALELPPLAEMIIDNYRIKFKNVIAILLQRC